MAGTLKKDRDIKTSTRVSKADQIARELGATRFAPEKAVVDPDFELDEFLKWRNERRVADTKEKTDCLP
ncbi:MAG: hypothetical protein AB7F88_08345 [Pyrinomonadaceae bacterium]